MHVIGFWHEHTRPDRDKYIEIRTEYLPKEGAHNWDIKYLNQANMVGEYDLCSVMHYGPNAASTDENESIIVPLHKECSKCYGETCNNCWTCPLGIGIGQRRNWTEMDLEKINLYYDCKKIGTLYYIILPAWFSRNPCSYQVPYCCFIVQLSQYAWLERDSWRLRVCTGGRIVPGCAGRGLAAATGHGMTEGIV